MKEINLVTQISEDLKTKLDPKGNLQANGEKVVVAGDFIIGEKYASFVRIKTPQWITKTQTESADIYQKEHV